MEESESYADDFGEDGGCDGDETELSHDGPGNETRPDPALVSTGPALEVSDLGDGATGPCKEVPPAMVVGESDAGGSKGVDTTRESADAGDTPGAVAISPTSAEIVGTRGVGHDKRLTAVGLPREGQGATIVERDAVGGYERHGNGAEEAEGGDGGGFASAGGQEDQEDVVELVEEDAEQEGSDKPISAALSRPSMAPKTADPNSPAFGSIKVDGDTPGNQTQEVDQRHLGGDLAGVSPETTSETPRVLDEAADDQSLSLIHI